MATFADQMTALAGSVVASRRASVLAVHNIKAQTMDLMSGFARAHRDMGRQLKAGLAAGTSARTQQVDGMRRANRKAHRETGRELRYELVQTIARIASAVASLRESASRQRTVMAQAQRVECAGARAARITARAACVTDCAVRMSEMVRSRQDMARQLQRTLGASTAAIVSEVAELRRGFNVAQGAVRTDLRIASRIWQTRGGGAPSAPSARCTTVLGPVQRLGNAFSELVGGTSASESHAEPKLRKSWSKLSDEEKVLRIMQGYPEGASAASIGEKVSLHAGVVGKIMKELMARGEIRRDENTRLYFSAK